MLPEKAADVNAVLSELKKNKFNLGFDIKSFKIVRRSIDARKKPVKINLGILVSDQEKIEVEIKKKNYNKIGPDAKQVVIVGAGPAGLFAALRAIELSLRPIVIERGKDVDSRRLDISKISRDGVINKDSNYCFGEGGAGAFSDGKLFTRSKKRGNVTDILETLCQFGASENILIDSHPHIGSDKLPKIIKNIREQIISSGGEVRFGTKMQDLIINRGKTEGIVTADGEKIFGPVFLATGHSSRDTFYMLKDRGVKMEPKGIAIGVRLEHPQHLIDKMQYHSKEGRGEYLPAAEYSFVNQIDQRGVYSFCMCPGGVIVPAVSDNGQIVVNGMSASARSGRWANSGYVVEVRPGDIKEYGDKGSFEMLSLQEDLEKRFFEQSENTLKAPAQKITDFINDKVSESLPATSYVPGIHPSNLNLLFPVEISERLKGGLLKIGEKCKDFISDEGVMIGLESRTSSPLRIPRDPETLCHVEIEDLYPVGEGAGYAGGIVSSAIDGVRSIDAYYAKLSKNG